jgi:hypothetical protein
MRFEFDPAKSASNKIKHGLDFTEVQVLWSGPRVEVQAKTAGREVRYAALGRIGGIHHTVIITYRAAAIRIISARKSSENEIAIYEKYKK